MFLTRDEVREFDRRAIDELGVPALVLMENAGRGAAEVLVNVGMHGPVVVCCGKGNNGGDGMVLARHLFLKKYPVKLLLFAQPAELSAEAKVHWDIVRRLQIPADVVSPDDVADTLRRADWIVDALFGTGLTRAIGAPLDRLVEHINASRAKVFALDIPSGLDADTGKQLGPTVRAHHTATFVAQKTGFAQVGATAWLGRVHVVGIGV